MTDTVWQEIQEQLDLDEGVRQFTHDSVEDYSRNFPQMRVQDARIQKDQIPAIIFDLEGQSEPRAGEGTTTLRRQARRLVCFARTYEELEDLAKAVETALTGYVSSRVCELFVASQDDDYENEINIHERTIELSVLTYS